MNKHLWIALVLLLSLLLTACAQQDASQTDSGAANAASSSAASSADESVDETETEAEEDEPFHYSQGIDDNGFWTGVTALDCVSLPAYEGLEIPAQVHNITDQMVEQEIELLLNDATTIEQITDRAVEDGDTVHIDFVGSINGVEFEGGSTLGQGTDVTIGVTNYVDDFLEQLIGHMPGETIDVQVTFPADYGKEDLNGKDAVFVVTIHYIAGETIRPELTDTFVEEAFAADYGWTTVDELREGLRESLRLESVTIFFEDYLLENSIVHELPESMLDYQHDSMLQFFETNAAYFGMDLVSFIQAYTGLGSVVELEMQYYDSMMQTAQFYLIIQAIAEDADITLTANEAQAYLTEQLGVADPDEYLQFYGKGFVWQSALLEKVLAYIESKAVLL